MKDFIGRELDMGDSVIIISPKYRQLVLARIIAFTPKQVRVAYRNTWNYGKEGMYMELLQWPDQLTKVDGPDLTVHLLTK